MLVELRLVEQRYQAVLEVLNDGASVTDVARRYGVARQTLHGWLRAYAAEGLRVWRIGRRGRCRARIRWRAGGGGADRGAASSASGVGVRGRPSNWLEHVGVVPSPGRTSASGAWCVTGW
jgi:hypothetical protein